MHGKVLMAILITGLSAISIDAAAEAGASDRFSFIVLGHVRGDRDGDLNPWIDTVLDEVRRLSPDLLFLTGDMIWGDYNSPRPDGAAILRDWELLDAKLATLGIPVYRVPGNHDLNDPVSERIYLERYGPLPERVDFGNSRFLLMNSTVVGQTELPMPVPRRTIGGSQLDPQQREWLRAALSASPRPEHAFLFMHHILWWRDNADWWREVHPILVEHPVRAVFGGDYGPMKFSHVNRDGIDYLQSSIEGHVSLEMLGALASARLLSQQFDCFLQVTVDGPEVRYDVRTVLALESGKFTPERRQNLYSRPPPPPPLAERIARLLRQPKVLIAGGVGGVCCFLAGLVIGRWRFGGRAG